MRAYLELGKIGIEFLKLRFKSTRMDEEGWRKECEKTAKKLLKKYDVVLDVEGQPGDGYLCANHTSWLDTLILPAQKMAGAVAKAETQNYPVMGKVFQTANCLFVERDKKSSRRETIEAIKNWPIMEKPLWVLPEGTCTANDEIGEFKKGIFVAAEKTGAPINVMVFYYTNQSLDWSRENSLIEGMKKYFYSGSGTIVKGRWIAPITVERGKVEEAMKELRARMQTVLKELIDSCNESNV